MNHDTPNKNDRSASYDGWTHASSFVSSILSGAILGYLADMWLDTAPWLVVIGIVLGSYSGFMKMWEHAKELDDHPRAR